MLPPVFRLAELGPAAGQLEEFLVQEAEIRTAGRAVSLRQFVDLSAFSTRDNLLDAGRFDPGELAALGSLAESRLVLACELIELRPYPPQRLVASVVLVEAPGAAVAARRVLTLDLGDTATRRRFAQFTGGQAPAVSLREDRTLQLDRVHEASLAPTQFQRFAAHEIVAAILRDARM